MAKAATFFVDQSGKAFPSPQEAAVSDLALALGRTGEYGGQADAIARMLFENRQKIEGAFRDLDELLDQYPAFKAKLADIELDEAIKS